MIDRLLELRHLPSPIKRQLDYYQSNPDFEGRVPELNRAIEYINRVIAKESPIDLHQNPAIGQLNRRLEGRFMQTLLTTDIISDLLIVSPTISTVIDEGLDNFSSSFAGISPHLLARIATSPERTASVVLPSSYGFVFATFNPELPLQKDVTSAIRQVIMNKDGYPLLRAGSVNTDEAVA
jgi:hypothetical protein